MPFTADSIAAQQVQDCLKSLYGLVHEIEEKRQLSENGIITINKFNQEERTTFMVHAVVRCYLDFVGNRPVNFTHTCKDAVSGLVIQIGILEQTDLKTLYKTAVSQAEQEEDLLRNALQKITDIRNIKNERRIQARNAGNKETIRRGAWMKMLLSSAQALPLFVSKIGEKPPPLCGAIPAEPNYFAKVGDMVAALAKVAEGDGDNWILAEVVSYSHALNKYEVDDILEEQNQKKRHILSKKCVVPLPLMRANPETDHGALFPQGSIILALYPQTTCFYKAIVNKLPQTHTDEYEVLFEDFTYSNGYSPPLYVAQRYVIAMKQKTKQT